VQSCFCTGRKTGRDDPLRHTAKPHRITPGAGVTWCHLLLVFRPLLGKSQTAVLLLYRSNTLLCLIMFVFQCGLTSARRFLPAGRDAHFIATATVEGGLSLTNFPLANQRIDRYI